MDILSKLEEIAKNQSLPSIGPIKGKILYEIIQKYNPKNILEVGTLHGYSAILMTNSLLDINDNQNTADSKINEIVVVTIEIDKNLANIAKNNIQKAGLSDKIKIINGNALEIIPDLYNRYKFDFVFLDAEKIQYFGYLKLIEDCNLLNRNAVIVADNVILYEDEMRNYLNYVRYSGKYNSYTTQTTLEFTKNIKDALEVSVRRLLV